MSTTATVSVGSGSTSPIVSLVFAEMVSRSQAVQEFYLGDLYHDALTLRDLFLGASTGSTVTFWWVLRPYGTYLTIDRVKAHTLADSVRRATVYRFVVREELYPGNWVVEITRERVAASRKLPPVEHIRRDDEYEITYCGLFTAICADPSDTAPIAVGPAGGDVAIYADQEHLAGYRRCGTCDDNYFAV